jgi:phage terminase Nu1 subunit (DNA packaging protein)
MKRNPEAIHPEHVYTLDALAAAVGASRRTIRGWIRQGLPASKTGQKLFIVGSDFADWIQSKKAKK